MVLNTFPGDIAQAFSVIHRAFLRDTKQEYAALGLNPTSAYILLYLAQHGPSTQSTLAHALIIDKGQITREIKKSVTLGFVTKKLFQLLIAPQTLWQLLLLAKRYCPLLSPFVISGGKHV